MGGQAVRALLDLQQAWKREGRCLCCHPAFSPFSLIFLFSVFGPPQGQALQERGRVCRAAW